MIDRVAFSIFGFDIYWYGIIMAAACGLGVALAYRRCKSLGHDPEFLIDLTFFLLPVSIVFARIYYVIFEWEFYFKNPSKIFAIRDGGIAIYGAVIGGLFAIWLFRKFYKKPLPSFLEICDILAPSLILGQAIGRWGNFVNQEAYSYIVAPSWMKFPLAVYIEAIGQWRLATFFYESLWNFMVFGALMWYSKKERKKGNVFLWYVVLYGFGRMFIEGLRSDSLWLIPGYIRVSQLLSAFMVIFGLAALYYRNKSCKGLKEQ